MLRTHKTTYLTGITAVRMCKLRKGKPQYREFITGEDDTVVRAKICTVSTSPAIYLIYDYLTLCHYSTPFASDKSSILDLGQVVVKMPLHIQGDRPDQVPNISSP
jgi:hypothetical protein